MTAEKIPFFTRYNYPKPEPNETGTEYDMERQWQIDDKGNKKLVITGKTNRYEKIQEMKDECNIHNILAKAVIDPTALYEREGFYGDISEMPKNMAEFQTLMQNLKNEYNNLPDEQRNKFKSFEEYCAEAGTESWMKKMNLIQETVENEKKGEIENEPEQ